MGNRVPAWLRALSAAVTMGAAGLVMFANKSGVEGLYFPYN